MNFPLLAATASSVVFIDINAGKSDVSTPVNIEGVTCSVWSTEGDAFIGTNKGSVERIDKSGVVFGSVYAGATPVVALVVRDATTLVVGHPDNVLLVDISTGSAIGSPIQVTGTLKSLALSIDKELLSITTESSVVVRNLTTNTSIPLNLRHLPTSFGCTAFHPQRRTVLIAACGSQLVVFDSAKPNTPLKIVSLGATVVDLTFLPNGKGCLAVATEHGDSYIVDVEKEKFNTKKFAFKHKLTALSLGVDSSSIVVGTAGGQVLMQDIRASDKSIRSISIGISEPILALNLQKKATPTRTGPTRATSTVGTARGQHLGERNVQRTVSATRATRKVFAESETPAKEVTRTKPTNRATTPPVATRRALKRDVPALSDRENTQSPPVVSANVTRRKVTSPREKKVAPAISRTVRRTSGTTSSTATSPASVLSIPRSRISSGDVSPSIENTQRRVSSALSRATTNRTPSPNLPLEDDVSTMFQGEYEIAPIQPVEDEGEEITAGLTPVIAIDLSHSPSAKGDPWLAAAKKGPSKIERSGIKTPTRNESTPPLARLANAHKQMELVSGTPPRRTTLPGNKRAFGSGVMQVSPMRSPAQMGTPNAAHAQELVRAVVREALLERDEEHREELRAMHLDLVKMSRTMKNDLRSLMEEYLGDFKSLREENQRLRTENERLRRGY